MGATEAGCKCHACPTKRGGTLIARVGKSITRKEVAMQGYTPPPPSKILLAVTPDMLARFQHILRRHETHHVASARTAMRELSDHYKLVVLGVHFDESQMFSLLGDIRAHSNYRKIPVLCVLGTRGPAITDIAIEGLDHAVKALRANGFLDLSHFADDEEGNARIARIVDYLILIDGDLQHIARALDDSVVEVERRRAH
jgi:PleD family two-component response regulator